MITKEYIIEHFSKLDENLIILSSDYTSDHTHKLLSNDNIEDFNPVRNIYASDMEVYSDFSSLGTTGDYILKQLLELLPDMQDGNNMMCLNRDVEDGYVYSDYDYWTFNDKYLVLA